jgi:hypothetical protein
MASLISVRARARVESQRRGTAGRFMRGRRDIAARPAREHERLARGATLLVGCAVGAVAEAFFDPQAGRRRRHVARDHALATLRHRSHDAVRRSKYLVGVAEGAAYRATHLLPRAWRYKEPPDDVTLAQKVESVAFRKARVPKAQVSVNAENGVIFLRGQLDSEDQVERIVQASGEVSGVKEVKNLLHTPAATSPKP